MQEAIQTTVIDGKKIAASIKEEVKVKVSALKKKHFTPCLAVILVGEDPASISYVTGKRKALADIGMMDRSIMLKEETTENEVVDIIKVLNRDESVHGILVQLPLPKHINEKNVIYSIDPMKDVDGFHPLNVGKVFLAQDAFLPCTPKGIVMLLETLGIKTEGKHAVIVGRSNIVGKPLSLLLLRRGTDCTVTVCHTKTNNLKEYTLGADILICAAGSPNTITADMVKEGAVVIDVGVNRVKDETKKSGYRLVGDCDTKALIGKASYITPVPGGVGPLTIAMLMQNVLEAALRFYAIKSA